MQAELDLFGGPADAPEAAAPGERPRREGLMTALDALNQRFGKGAVAVASAARLEAQGAALAAPRQQWRSPRYTTRLDEIPTARA
ncbi:MAG: DUF4113 domain-containing protein [Burkholderiaceae bacterium]